MYLKLPYARQSDEDIFATQMLTIRPFAAQDIGLLVGSNKRADGHH